MSEKSPEIMLGARHKACATHYLPPETATPEILNQQKELFLQSGLLGTIMQTLPGSLLVMNSYRQIVFANEAALEFLGKDSINEVLGYRPGGALACVFPKASGLPCGSTDHCGFCKAAHAFNAARKGRGGVFECSVQRSPDLGSLDLRIRSTPFLMDDQQFIMFGVENIAHERRLRAVERMLLGQLYDMARSMSQAVFSLSSLVERATGSKALGRRARDLAGGLLAKMDAYAIFCAAEEGRVEVQAEDIELRNFLEDLVHSCIQEEFAAGITVKLSMNEGLRLKSDRRLISRILYQMLQNACEASKSGDCVELGCYPYGNGVRFWVHNDLYMARWVRSQVFQRSFSTKDKSRGLGAYGMKLIAEKILGGSVHFKSSSKDGTTFYADIPSN